MSNKVASAAIVECKIRRDGGSDVEMADKTVYNFRPNATGQHVCLVADMNHITRFMQIPTSYSILSLLADDSPILVAATEAPSAPIGAVAPVAPTAPVVAPVAPTAPIVPQAAAQQTADLMALPSPDADGTYSEASLAQLREIFKLEIGRPPSPKSKGETMVAQIEGMRAAKQTGGAA